MAVWQVFEFHRFWTSLAGSANEAKWQCAMFQTRSFEMPFFNSITKHKLKFCNNFPGIYAQTLPGVQTVWDPEARRCWEWPAPSGLTGRKGFMGGRLADCHQKTIWPLHTKSILGSILFESHEWLRPVRQLAGGARGAALREEVLHLAYAERWLQDMNKYINFMSQELSSWFWVLKW